MKCQFPTIKALALLALAVGSLSANAYFTDTPSPWNLAAGVTIPFDTLQHYLGVFGTKK